MRKPYLAVAFILGCATAPLMEQVVKPRPAVAQAGVRKWEQYCTFRMGYYEGVPDKMNPDLKEQGQQGWELVSASATQAGTPTLVYYCFKRPVP